MSLTGKAFLSRLCEVLSLTPSTIKTTNKIPPLEADAGQCSSPGPGTCEVSGTFLTQFTSLPCLALSRIGGLYIRVAGSSPSSCLAQKQNSTGLHGALYWSPILASETTLPQCRILLLGPRDIQRECDPQSGVQPPPPQSQIMSPSTMTTAYPARLWPVIQDLTNPFCLSMTHVSSG